MDIQEYRQKLQNAGAERDAAARQRRGRIQRAVQRPSANPVGVKSHSATKGLFSHIQKNNAKSVLVLLVFLVLIQMVQLAFVVFFTPIDRHVHTPFSAVHRQLGTPIDTTFQPISNKINQGTGSKINPYQPPKNTSTLQIMKHDVVQLWTDLIVKGKAFKQEYLLIFIPFLLYILGGFWFASVFVKRQTGARRVSKAQEPRLFNIVERLTISRGLPMPAVEIIESPGRNAYASGFHPKNSALGVTRGLLVSLNDRELEAVLAHEVAHIEGRDNRLMTLANLSTGAVANAGRVLVQHVQDSPILSGLSIVFIAFVAPTTPLLIVLSLIFGAWGIAECIKLLISQKREFIADARAIEIMKSPAALISALKKVSMFDRVDGLNPDVQAMMISNLSGGGLATHPSIEARIRAIEETTSVNDVEVQAAGQNIYDEAHPSHQWNFAPTHNEADDSAFGRRKATISTGEANTYGDVLEDAKLESTYHALLTAERCINAFVGLIVKAFQFLPLLWLVFLPVVLVSVLLSALTGINPVWCAGALILWFVWRKFRNNTTVRNYINNLGDPI